MYESQERMPVEVEGTLVSIRERKEGENQDLYRAISRNAHNLKEAIKIARKWDTSITAHFMSGQNYCILQLTALYINATLYEEAYK
jgi:hypothetical protein